MLDLVALGVLQDFQFLVQLFIAVSIASFVLNHLGKGAPAIVAIGVLFFIVFVMIPLLAEFTFIIYLLLMTGISSLIVDFFFVSMNTQGKQGQSQEITGIDVQHRQHAMHQAQAQMGMRRGR